MATRTSLRLKTITAVSYKLNQNEEVEVTSDSEEYFPSKTSSKKYKGPRGTGKRSIENETIDGWTVELVKTLCAARNYVDPLSNRFWDDVASYVDGKNFLECQEKWFQLKSEKKKTNKRYPKKKKQNVWENKENDQNNENNQNEDFAEDDIFNSTPAKLHPPPKFSFSCAAIDFGSPLVKSDATPQKPDDPASEDENDRIIGRPAGFKSYIKDLSKITTYNRPKTKPKSKRRLKVAVQAEDPLSFKSVRAKVESVEAEFYGDRDEDIFYDSDGSSFSN